VFSVGEAVRTPFGKGVVRALRNNGRLLVDVDGRALVVAEREVVRVDAGLPSTTLRAGPATALRAGPTSTTPERDRPLGTAPSEVDLHGLTVEEALVRVDAAIDAALRADLETLRFIHGRSGGRLRAALHRRLKAISSVRGYRLDPRNEGVTIVML